jgi:ribosomal protein S27E
MLIDILLLALFIERIGHVAMAKGRRPWQYRFLTLGVGLAAWFIGSFLAGIGIGIHSQATGTPLTSPSYRLPTGLFTLLCVLVAGVILWLIVRNLPVLQGAPGEKYLFIEFSCPECAEHIAFKRHHAGLLVDCPKCGKKVVVPEDSVPKEPPPLPEEK